MQANQLDLTERCELITALRRSLRYLHHHLLKAQANHSETCCSYWLTEIRVAYRLYRRVDFVPSSFDRYHALVEFVTTEAI